MLPLLLFGKFARDVAYEGGLSRDAAWLESLHRRASPSLDATMLSATRLGGPASMTGLALIVTLTLLLRGRRRSAAFFSVAVGGAIGLNLLVKLLFRRDRPSLWETLVAEGSYSFPSGHAMGTMAVFVAGAFLLRGNKLFLAYLLAGSLLVLTVGASRLYLGVHYPSDVLGGWCAALAWVVGVSYLIRRSPAA